MKFLTKKKFNYFKMDKNMNYSEFKKNLKKITKDTFFKCLEN